MKRAVRVGLVVLGAAMAVYGFASLTGGWLGTPPWWERRAHEWEAMDRQHEWLDARFPDWTEGRRTWDETMTDAAWAYMTRVPIAGREWISGAVGAAGLALVGVGAWPRRRRARRRRAPSWTRCRWPNRREST